MCYYVTPCRRDSAISPSSAPWRASSPRWSTSSLTSSGNAERSSSQLSALCLILLDSPTSHRWRLNFCFFALYTTTSHPSFPWGERGEGGGDYITFAQDNKTPSPDVKASRGTCSVTPVAVPLTCNAAIVAFFWDLRTVTHIDQRRVAQRGRALAVRRQRSRHFTSRSSLHAWGNIRLTDVHSSSLVCQLLEWGGMSR